jgi:uncharacterized membrane protein
MLSWIAWLAFALSLSIFISRRAYKKKSLDISGAYAAFFVGFACIFSSVKFGVLLLVFFFTSSKLTAMGKERKRSIDFEFKEGEGQRNYVQVFANGLFCSIIAMLWYHEMGFPGVFYDQGVNFSRIELRLPSLLLVAYISATACNTGDTWSSEIGVLSNSKPRLITNLFRFVPTGTNGGISLLGLIGATCGGLTIGICAWLCQVIMHLVTSVQSESNAPAPLGFIGLVLVGVWGGLGGSLLDSLLGATLQYSGWDEKIQKVVHSESCGTASSPRTAVHISGIDILDNHAVNALSSILMGVVTPFMVEALLRQY